MASRSELRAAGGLVQLQHHVHPRAYLIISLESHVIDFDNGQKKMCVSHEITNAICTRGYF